MKIMKIIITLSLVFTISFSNVVDVIAETSPAMKAAIQQSKYYEQRIKLEKQIDQTFAPKFTQLTNSYKFNLEMVNRGINKYNDVISKLDVKLSRIDSNNPIQSQILKPLFIKVKNMVIAEKNILLIEKVKLQPVINTNT
jgi:hypothetical protein